MRHAGLTWLLALTLPSALAGQSVLGARGLGTRVEALDAVERALGGVGVVTTEATILPGNPVASLDLLAPTIAFTAQPHWGHFTTDSEQKSFVGTRFPIFGVAYPLGTNGVVTLTAGSQFDQNWTVQSEDSISTGVGTIGTTDTFVSDGGITAIQAGFARHMSSAFAVGASIGVYRGGLERSFVRTFEQEAPGSVSGANPIEPFGVRGRWSHSGVNAAVNGVWSASSVLKVGATVAWGGKVKVDPAEREVGLHREVSVPLEFKVSASAALNPTLSLNAGVSSSNWSDLGDEGVDDVAAGRVTSYGAGLEWEATNFWAGPLPVRFGFRRSAMPFQFEDSRVQESTISFGLSVVMAQSLGFPLAVIDLAFEIGNRDAGDFQESLRRITVSTRVGGL